MAAVVAMKHAQYCLLPLIRAAMLVLYSASMYAVLLIAGQSQCSKAACSRCQQSCMIVEAATFLFCFVKLLYTCGQRVPELAEQHCWLQLQMAALADKQLCHVTCVTWIVLACNFAP